MGRDTIRNWFQERMQADKKPQSYFAGLFLGLLLLSLAACSSALAAETHPKIRVYHSASHGAQLLPPAWTPTPLSSSSSSNDNPTPIPYAIPTQSVQVPLYTYQETPIIGHSVKGRLLDVFQFGSGPRDLMIVAGIHGGYEWIDDRIDSP